MMQIPQMTQDADFADCKMEEMTLCLFGLSSIQACLSRSKVLDQWRKYLCGQLVGPVKES